MSRAHRPSTTPMDFEWTNGEGPVDARSPFLNANANANAGQQGGMKRKLDHFASDTRHAQRQQHQHDGLNKAPPGPHSVLDSPSKSSHAYNGAFATPNRSGYFNHTGGNKPLPSTPASSLPAHIQNHQAWEPRTPASTYDFSSGGETPNTPQVDSDVGTPDTQLAGKMGRLGGESSRKPARRDSWMSFKVKEFFGGSPSPSKSERDRDRDRRDADTRRPSSRKEKEGRIVKRRPERSRSKKRHALHHNSDDSDTETPSSHTNNNILAPHNPSAPAPAPAPAVVAVVQETFIKRLGNLFHWVEAHPALPTVLSIYAQFLVNSLLGLGFLYIIYCAWAGIMSDVDIESSKHTAEVMVEISACATDYQRNHCGTANMAPALESVCGVWEACMSRDPRKVARASVTAKTFAVIFNSFVEEFSYKSMIFTAIIIFGGFNLSNWAFGWLRSPPPSSTSSQHQQPQDYPPPQTPHMILSNQYQQHLLQNDAQFQREVLNQENWNNNWNTLPQMQMQVQTPGRVGGEWSRDGVGMGTGAGGRYIEAPPPLVHAHSMPAAVSGGGSGSGSTQQDVGTKSTTTRKRGLFR
ncbi:hypothetical protein NX059_012473 [Plenodomus lindquistii]|nr:hypothetical protein NX059_012473 [Plenodomus lindquistii]